MSLWIIFAVMTAFCLWIVLRPLNASGRTNVGAEARDVAVYRDQLAQIEKDLGLGVISSAEAEASGTEISRRLLGAAERSEALAARGGRDHTAFRRLIAGATLVLIPALVLGFYLNFGAPHLPDRPHAKRLADTPGGQSVAVLILRAEAQLRKTPDDVQGWLVLAPAYKRLGRYNDAVNALEQIMRVEGRKPATLAEYGEALVLVEHGVISKKARAVFEEAVGLDAVQPKARFYLARVRAQDGDLKGALAALRKLGTDLPGASPWQAVLRRVIANGETQLAKSAATAPVLDKETVEAAGRMTAQQRQAMISGMVERLAQRLKDNGRDLEGWLRLARAYRVLGQFDKARTALTDAGQAFAGDEKALARIEAAGKAHAKPSDKDKTP